MREVYAFLYYTLSLSALALLLLLVKGIFRDKLSPRWQYGVWYVLALRAVLPLNGRELFSPLRQLTELLRQLLEPGLDSAFASLSRAVEVRFPLPWITAAPRSLTDWLFVLYALGAALALFWQLFCYFRLRRLLKRGRSPSARLLEQLETVCKAYGLSSCPVYEVEGLSSPLICGVVRPILAVPAGTLPEDSVLLHELLHLRYRDPLQSLFWCVFRAVNWCNPLLRMVCRRIGNDLESLCDQRVLERLEGEARREYGRTLLSMVNERYPRAPGTTSLSNGGAFIARRIEAIARFKRYPRGMSLVSGCMCILLAAVCFCGSPGGAVLHYSEQALTGTVLEQALAASSARLFRCTTPAGAVDTYAKGLINENLLYLAAASPLASQAALLEQGRQGVFPWLSANEWQYSGYGSGYELYNLERLEDGSYRGSLIYRVGPAEGDPPPPENAKQEWYAVYSLSITRQDDRWTVTQYAAPLRQEVLGNDLFALPALTEYRAEGESGTVSVLYQTRAVVNNAYSVGLFGGSAFDHAPKPDAVFTDIHSWYRYHYDCTAELSGVSRVTMLLQARSDTDEAPAFSAPDDSVLPDSPYVTSSSSSGGASISRQVDEDWNRVLDGGAGKGWGSQNDLGDVIPPAPVDYAVRILMNGQPAEDFYPKEVQP